MRQVCLVRPEVLCLFALTLNTLIACALSASPVPDVPESILLPSLVSYSTIKKLLSEVSPFAGIKRHLVLSPNVSVCRLANS